MCKLPAAILPIFVLSFIFSFGDGPAAFAESVAAQVETCRQHVVELTEQSRKQQTKLTTLRAERKTIGVSGGEVARFKLANLDQELRELTKQNQTVNAQIDSEKKRCDSLGSKAPAGKR